MAMLAQPRLSQNFISCGARSKAKILKKVAARERASGGLSRPRLSQLRFAALRSRRPTAARAIFVAFLLLVLTGSRAEQSERQGGWDGQRHNVKTRRRCI